MLGIQKISKHGAEEIKLIAEAAKNYTKIEAIYLFGSCTRHEDTENSDIDTLIIWNGFNSESVGTPEGDKNGIESFNFVNEVFKNKKFSWDRMFIDSTNELKQKDSIIYKNIVKLNNIIYKRKTA